MIVIDLDAQRQVYLVHKHHFSKLNDNVMHTLILINIISVYSWTVLLKGKMSSEKAMAFENNFTRGI